jgi:hypothetical protein
MEKEVHMIKRKLYAVLSTLLLLLFPITGAVSASTVSNTVAVTTTLTIPESVSLTTSSPTITLTNTAPSQTITLTASWQISSGHTTMPHIYSWFTTIPFATISSGVVNIPSNHFTTVYNGGAPTVCDQGGFLLPNGSGAPFGVSSQNCGIYQLSQNPATDLNDSVAVSFTLAADNGTFSLVPTTYSGGVFNILFEIV